MKTPTEQPDKSSSRIAIIVVVILMVVTWYVAISINAYRFRHPQLTETQLFLHTWEALRWR